MVRLISCSRNGGRAHFAGLGNMKDATENLVGCFENVSFLINYAEHVLNGEL